ncbi:kinase-like domain-containing protein [Pisolithus thermaeus]|nr:kinase-like domain-containing protein [Pisolithus thermaeus]
MSSSLESVPSPRAPPRLRPRPLCRLMKNKSTVASNLTGQSTATSSSVMGITSRPHEMSRIIISTMTDIARVPRFVAHCALQDEDALCGDPGLPDNLFRATRHKDGKKLVIKAVNLLSRELDVARYISSPALRRDPMNHCIPIFDFLDVPTDGICFVVMEEWSSCLLSRLPATMHEFLSAIHQCIEHIVFLHRYHIVHLDISIYNFVTDYRGHYACIDYELSRRLDIDGPQVFSLRGTEIPPELERGEASDPYMVDIWALAMLILRACQATGYGIPELLQIARKRLGDYSDQWAGLRTQADGILELAANNYLVTQSI